MLTLVWTFNVSAITLAHRADLLRRVVFNSWELLVLLAVAQCVWSLWILYVGAPAVVAMAAIWLGVNLLLTVGLVQRHARDLSGGQIVLVCSWWLGLLAMLLHALHLGAHPPLEP
jgi:hypothetical protein